MQLARFIGNKRGDTIVEVLIAIAVVSAVLGSAYAMTSRNVQNSQQAQEHSQALKVAESQVELLKSYVAAGNTLPTSGNNFCLYVNTVPNPDVNSLVAFTGAGTSAGLPTIDSNYPTNCKFSDGVVAQRFMAGISEDASNTFTVSIAWDGPTGGRDTVSLLYKVYP
jgi:Tfp pilus assembly protein PilV